METCNGYVERPHQFPEMELVIREFAFHQLNANFLWPGTFSFAEWLMHHREWIERRRCIELGSGTGALAIFLRKAMNLDITTSDYNDQEIEDNIAYNSTTNGITPALPHIKHSWGDAFPIPNPDWDLILASDILLLKKLSLSSGVGRRQFSCVCVDDVDLPFRVRLSQSEACGWSLSVRTLGSRVVDLLHPISLGKDVSDELIKDHHRRLARDILDVKQYSNLIKSLSVLLKSYKPKDSQVGHLTKNEQGEGTEGLPWPAFLMSWRRRIGKEDETLFFTSCENAGLEVKHLGSRVYCIKLR
ncbi:S-adenosyl-L-methionine-dependent methyltransferases superfamily protein [Citrus sinensis]|uniref:S-adenosyl-L-methionine-dependent methyltransferases superfamily protein n=1 Tax=Citrus sinensis TaxID=2711 RepID=A0ACB8JUT0_CITSI|nr:S-adenosyl-L-methionine-dependent methyltransferases superfamily protein [Citrus sinensis]